MTTDLTTGSHSEQVLAWNALKTERLRKRVVSGYLHPLEGKDAETSTLPPEQALLRLGAAAAAKAIRKTINQEALASLISEIGEDAWRFSIANIAFNGAASLPKRGVKKACLIEYGGLIYARWLKGSITDSALDDIIKRATS